MTKIDGWMGIHFPMLIASECPYCGNTQTNTLRTSPEIVGCDEEFGGCEKRYVVRLPWSVPVVVTALKIEGEE